MFKNVIHMLVVVAVIVAGMSVARAEDHGRVLYVGNEKGICDVIGPFVDVCRERDIPKGTVGMVALQKYISYTKDKNDFGVVIDEAKFQSKSYNPSGLIISISAVVVGGGFGQGAMIGNRNNPFGNVEVNSGNFGFQIYEGGDRKEVRCDDVAYPECRARMLEEIKRRWPRKG